MTVAMARNVKQFDSRNFNMHLTCQNKLRIGLKCRDGERERDGKKNSRDYKMSYKVLSRIKCSYGEINCQDRIF